MHAGNTAAACKQDDIISRARVIRDNAHDFTISHAPRDQTAIDLSRVDTADPMDDPENDAEPAALQKAEHQSHDPAARPGGMDQASAAASALAMDVDPDRQLHSFEIDSTQVHNPHHALCHNSQCLHSTQVFLVPSFHAASPQPTCQHSAPWQDLCIEQFCVMLMAVQRHAPSLYATLSACFRSSYCASFWRLG